MKGRSKAYKNKKDQVKEVQYSTTEGIKLLKALPKAKFNESVEIHINLGIKEKSPVRATIDFKHSFAKPKKILAFVPADMVDQALAAGADYAGLEDYIKKIQGGWLDFDIVIALPVTMPKIAALGKILGTRGMMPNPKNGTVTNDLKEVIKGFKSGRINIKSDEYGIIHSVIGNLNNTEDQLSDNLESVIKGILDSLNRADGSPIRTVYLTSSMGPSIKIDTTTI